MKKGKILKMLFAMSSLIMIAFIANIVIARGIQGYDVTISREGSMTTGRIRKEKAEGAVNRNNYIGGNKPVHTSIRLSGTTQDVSETITIHSGERKGLAYYNVHQVIGRDTTLALATPVWVVVRVEARGSWSPDTND
jgi:hypothetical protein